MAKGLRLPVYMFSQILYDKTEDVGKKCWSEVVQKNADFLYESEYMIDFKGWLNGINDE